ncbi:peptidase domain-containing ABC transporter [bacterium]|nr:peptidase domain-containing ABC transporter [bacterium]
MKIVRQQDEKDCGVCSLLSIIRYYKGNVSLEQLRLDARTNNEGTTALNLVLASQKYGFDAVGMKVENLNDIKRLPAIAHLNLKKGYSHYVVIEKVTKDKIILMDPAKGKVVKFLWEFQKEWSGVVLIFYPKQKIMVLKNDVTLFTIFKKVFISEKNLIKIIVLVSFLLTIFTIALGYYFQMFNSLYLNKYPINYLKVLVLVFAIFTCFKLFLTYYRSYLENHLNKNIDCLITSDFLKHLFNLPLNVITSRKSGEILSRVNELTSIKGLITEIFITYTLDFLIVVITTFLLIRISSKLFLILFLTTIFYLFVGIITKKSIFEKAYQNISIESEFNNTVLENIKMINSIKNLDAVDGTLNKIERKLTHYLYDTYKVNTILNKINIFKVSCYEIGFFLINTFGFYFVYKGIINMIDLITFNALLNLYFEPLKNIVDSIPKYSFMKASITKINDFLGVHAEILGEKTSTDGYDISINNLNYSYNKYQNVLKSVNLNIKEGEFVLLQGASGSGKSTLCSILNKYITDYTGDILFGKMNYKDLSIKTIRENIVYVGQNENIFTGSIKENITFGNKVSDLNFDKICKICKVDDVANKKTFSYESLIGSDEGNISGGEKQRIILARAVLKDFNVLILDEALSEVDIKLELEILKSIRENYKDKTIIYISHKKYSNIFDKVINMEAV